MNNDRLDLEFIKRCSEGVQEEKFQNSEKQRKRVISSI